MIVLTTLFYVLTYDSFKNLLGWPSSDSLPDRFRLIAAQIYEPNALINSEGFIYIWIADMDDLAGLSTPRSYSLKYNKEVHEKISKAQVNIKNGIPQMGEQVDENKNIISSVLKKEKASSVSSNLIFLICLINSKNNAIFIIVFLLVDAQKMIIHIFRLKEKNLGRTKLK